MAEDTKDEARCIGLRKQTAQHAKIVISSTDAGTYYFENPSIQPDTATSVPSISNLETIYWKNPLVHKGINLRANRLIGDGFELTPAEGADVNPVIAEQAKDECWKFLKNINHITFLRQSAINAYVAGNEWTEQIYNKLGTFVAVAHGDFRTIDFRRSFITQKILIDNDGTPEGYWQYIENLTELYQSLSMVFGSKETYESLTAAKNRLLDTQQYMITDENGKDVAVMTKKPNYMFLKKEEIAHLSFNNLNDNWFGVSLIIPAYDAATHLNQVMYATAEAINEMGYPKPIVYVGDKDHPPNENLNTTAENAITDPVRKEGFVLPYYTKMEYLQPAGTGSGNINDYPQWFVTAVSIGLRVPRELLTGEGEANRANSMQNSTDFDRDIEADRRQLEEYVYGMLSTYLSTHQFKTNASGRNPYVPEIKWRRLVSEDEKIREDMVLAKWNAGLVNYNEAREALKLPEVEDPKRGEAYNDELQRGGQQSGAFPSLIPTQPSVEGQFRAQHRLDAKAELNPALNDKFHTEGVDYKEIAQDEVGQEIVTVGEKKAMQVRDTLVNSLAEQPNTNLKQLGKDIQKIGDYEPYEAKRIIRTELSNLVSTAREDDARRRGLTHKQWIAVLDGKTSELSMALDGQVKPIDEPFKVEFTDKYGKQVRWEGDKPPEHPNTRCKVIYLGTNPDDLIKEKKFSLQELEKVSESVGDLKPEHARDGSFTSKLAERTSIPKERIDMSLYDMLLLGFGAGAIAELIGTNPLTPKDKETYKKLADSVRNNPAKAKELMASITKAVKSKAKLKEIQEVMRL